MLASHNCHEIINGMPTLYPRLLHLWRRQDVYGELGTTLEDLHCINFKRKKVMLIASRSYNKWMMHVLRYSHANEMKCYEKIDKNCDSHSHTQRKEDKKSSYGRLVRHKKFYRILMLNISLKEPAGQCKWTLITNSFVDLFAIPLVHPTLAPACPLWIISLYNERPYKNVNCMTNDSLHSSCIESATGRDLYNEATCLSKYVESP